jgi:hypothetical protein
LGLSIIVRILHLYCEVAAAIPKNFKNNILRIAFLFAATKQICDFFLIKFEIMKFLEKDLEEMIFIHLGNHEGCKLLEERGLFLNNEIDFINLRQPSLSSYGIPDIVTISFGGRENKTLFLTINIIELKIVPLTNSHISQVMRYEEGIKDYISTLDVNIEVDFNLILIGSGYSDDFIWINQNISNLSSYVFNFDLKNGLNFELIPKGWRRRNFKPEETRLSKINYRELIESSSIFKIDMWERELKNIDKILF